MAAPADDANEKTSDIHGECNEIARRTKPSAARAHAQSMINLHLQDKAARDCKHDDGPPDGARSTGHRAQQRVWERMGNREPGVADRARRAQRSCPAQLMPQQFASRAL